ncbi:MAG: PQQ-binding-like beta-propeller repeat protein [Planctomycetaceae bacterium]
MSARFPAGLLGVLLCCTSAFAADWPTYLKDNKRSGATDEQIALPLVQTWVFKTRFAPRPGFGPGYPRSTNWEGGVEKRVIDFDRADAAVAVGGKVYFGSVGDGKVYCLDAASGRVVWTFHTDGPVRLAPAIVEGKAYFGSDDGHVYCVDAATGKQVWKFRAAPDDHKIIGNGRLISLWPVRTGVLVDKGAAYFSAGIFASEGVYSYAVEAASGKLIWKNDREGENRLKHVSPIGYQLATDDFLVVPMGRMAPAVYDRKSGQMLYKLFIYYGGGTFCTMYQDLLFSGWAGTQCWPIKREHPGAAEYGTSKSLGAFPGGRLVYADGMVYSCNNPKGNELSTSVTAIPFDPSGPNEAQKRRGNAPAPGDKKGWTVPFPLPESIILSGKTLFVGGKGKLAALDAADGKTLWAQDLPGSVLHLALSDGRLYVSCDTGEIYCFAAAGAKAVGNVAESVEDVKASPAMSAAADAILKLAPARKGFALVYGVETGELALELARRSELNIVAVSPDAAKVEAARTLQDKAGFYGGRAVVMQASLEKLPFTKYFANLVVSETAIVSGKPCGSAAEMVRVCTPLRGAVVLSGGGDALKSWAVDTPLAASEARDGWAIFKRPALPGAANWTAQYGTEANTGTSEDDLVRAPFRLQWFGEPGYEHMVDRHHSGSSPLAADGRLFVQTRQGVRAYDAYNGTELWFYELENAAHPNVDLTPGNAFIGPQGYYIVFDEFVRLLDPETGKMLKEYKLPAAEDGKRRTWGYFAVVDGVIVGSRSIGYMPVSKWSGDVGPVANSDVLFGMDAATGKVIWTYPTTWFRSNTLAIANGVVYIGYAQGAGGADLERALAEKEKYLPTFSKETQAALAKAGPWTMMLGAVDIKTGKPKWQRIVDVAPLGGAEATLAYKDGMLLHFSGIGGDKSFDGLIRGRWATRVIIARNAETGDVVWMKNYDYRGRLALIGQNILAEPFMLDLKTGLQKTVVHDITGVQTPWFFVRPYKNCGPFNASKHCLFFRNDANGYYDIDRNEGTATFDSHRPSCWMSFNSANGLASFPAGGSACRCPGTLQGTVVLVHDDENRVYGDFATLAGETLPVKHLYLNLGAMGDRRDGEAQLWLAHPRQKFKGGFELPIKAEFYEGGAFTRRDSTWNKIADTAVPWVFNSWADGLKSLTMQVRGPKDGPAKYTVKLMFAETAGAAPGKRVFDIKLQGKTVREGLDIAKEAAAPDKAVVLTFANIAATDTIRLDLVSGQAKPDKDQRPTLCGVTLVAE